MGLTKPFNEIGKDDAATAGGKGASLGEMIQAGIPVPPGFVVLADAFEQFIEATGLVVEIDAILGTVDHHVMHTVENASEQIQALILNAQMPDDLRKEIQTSFTKLDTEFVAVRSSATAEDSASAAWAGQLDTYLNTTEVALLENVQRCWASLFTPRAIFYRFEKGLDTHKISVAVVVQKMVNSDAAGIAFSVHPVTEDHNQMIIEAGFGLGEAVVSGQITPDSYVVTKDKGEIIEKSISEQPKGLFRKAGGGNHWRDIPKTEGNKQVLLDTQISTLAQTLIRIERHYGFPVDTEWVMEGDELYIVQSRPITTLKAKDGPTLQEIKSRVFECVVRFPRLSVLCSEAMNEGLCDNPLFSLADTIPNPSSVVFIEDSFEGWVGQAGRVAVSNAEAIQKIDKASLECIARTSVAFDTILTAEEAELSDPSVLIGLIEQANAASADTYKHFMFFIDESFKTSDQTLIEHLQKTRIELDTLVTKYLFPAFDKLVQALVEHHQFPQEIAERATTAEIVAALRTPERLKGYEALRSRPIAFVLLNGSIEILFDEEAREIQRYLAHQDPDKALIEEVAEHKLIRGSIGNKGIAKGRVRKLLAREFYDKEKLENLAQDRDFILIVSMTSPELVPYFEHALAFVTDEGGITCHAAIIARELGKPCVIGTKVATQALNDGDVIEVDADTGIIRILKSDIAKIALVKYFTRPHSLFYTFVWRDSNCKNVSRWLDTNIKEVLYTRPSTDETVDVWYSDAELDKYHKGIERKIQEDSTWFPKLSAYFEEEWGHIIAHINKDAPLTKEEFKDFYEHWLNWWEPMALMMQIPEVISVPQDIRDRAFKYRADTQEYSDTGDEIYLSYIRSTHPELKKYHAVLLPEEVLSEIFPLEDVLEERLKGWFITNETFGLIQDLSKELEKRGFALADPLQEHGEKVAELKGQTAFAGSVEGIVKVVRNQGDAAKVQKGDIMVSPMTSPDFLPAMLRAAAFVTDEGGVTCHAAIVAREMKKPCVIGTKVATSVLKDGDRVEVNADTGTVKIL